MNIRVLLLLFMAHLLTDFGQGSIPIVGQYLRDTAGLTLSQVGTLTLVSSLLSAVVQPLVGIYSDRARNGWMIPLGLAAVGAGVWGLAHASTYAWQLFFVALTGVGVATFHPEGMRAAHYASGGRTTGMSIFQVGGNAGYGLGPAAAGAAIAAAGLAGMTWIAVPPLLWALVMIVSLPAVRALWERRAAVAAAASTAGAGESGEPGDLTGRGKPAPSRAGQPSAPSQDRWGPAAMVLTVVALRAAFQFGLTTFLPIYYVEVRGGDPARSGLVLSLYLLVGALGTLVTGPIADRIGPRRYMALAMALLPVLHLATLATPGSWMLLFLALQGFFLVSQYAVSVVLNQLYVPNHLALVSGLNVGLGITVGGIGAATAGWIADAVGLVPTLMGMSVLPVIATVLAVRLPEPQPEPAAHTA
ncbi:MAG: MFS transporter [Thermaerobacter sp.]|nr:MFS transporter [Bacillota bacterium]